MSNAEVTALGDGGVIVRDGCLGDERAAALHAAAVRLDLRPAGVSRARLVDADLRGDEMCWLDPPALPALFTAFAALRDEALNGAAWLGVADFQIQLARYAGGGARYQRHRDAFAGGGAESRVVTAIYYLNPAWEPAHGGELVAHTPEGAVTVAPRLDRLVLFLSERVDHEVLPTCAPRLAATAWYYRARRF